MIELKKDCYVKMGWKYASYVLDGKKYVFYIEPMYSGNDIFYLPKNCNEYTKMIEQIKSINWNRNLEYVEANYEIKAFSLENLE